MPSFYVLGRDQDSLTIQTMTEPELKAWLNEDGGEHTKKLKFLDRLVDLLYYNAGRAMDLCYWPVDTYLIIKGEPIAPKVEIKTVEFQI